MNNDENNQSRVDLFEKKRKNTKLVTIISSLAGLLAVTLLFVFLIGGGEDNEPEQQAVNDQQENSTDTDAAGQPDSQQENDAETGAETGNQSAENDNEQDNAQTGTESEESNDEQRSSQEDSQQEKEQEEETQTSEGGDENSAVEKQQLETPDDSNVKEAYTADWEPVGTSQEGPHTVVIDQDTQEWAEIMKAVSLATGLERNNMIAWWVTRAGEQRVEATVTNSSQTEVYRVYLQWVTGEGYRPERVEVLEENDQKHR